MVKTQAFTAMDLVSISERETKIPQSCGVAKKIYIYIYIIKANKQTNKTLKKEYRIRGQSKSVESGSS